MSVLAKWTYFGRTAVQGVRFAPFLHTVAITTLAIALFGLGLARGGGRLLEGLLASLGSRIQLTVYLEEDVLPPEAQRLAAELARTTGGMARAVTPAEALSRLIRELGPLGEALKDLPENPLPASIELSIPPGERSAEALETLAAQVRQRQGVTGVDYGEAAIARLSAMVRALRVAGWVAFLIIVAATVLIVAATLQLAIYARRQEIEIQKLVGATERFVKAPFLMEGVFQGVLGASVALLGLWAFSTWVSPRWAALFSFLQLPSGGEGALVTWETVLELWTVGALLGLSGSFLAVSRFFRG